MITHRVVSLFVAAAFLACQVAVCACRAPRAEAPVKKAEAHSCCAKKSAPPVEKKAPVRESKSCCCSDGAHLAVVDDVATAAPQPEAAAPVLRVPAPVVAPARAPLCTGSPPGRPPEVPLYTLHASLVI